MKHTLHALLVVFAILYMQPTTLAQMPVDTDWVSFKSKGTNSIALSLLYAYPDTLLSYKAQGKKYQSQGNFDVVIYSPVDTIVHYEWSEQSVVDHVAMEHKNDYAGVKTFEIKPGRYTASVRVQDMHADSEEVYQQTFELLVPSISSSELASSGIVLGQSVYPANSTLAASYSDDFLFGTVKVVPLPSGLVIGASPTLGVVCELYQVGTYFPNGFVVEYAVENTYGDRVLQFEVERFPYGDSYVEAMNVALDTLPSGSYTVSMTIRDSETTSGETLTIARNFDLVNLGDEAGAVPVVRVSLEEEFAKSPFYVFGEERCDREFDFLFGRLSQGQRDLYNSLTEIRGKQRYLFSYWLHRDPEPDTRENEAREEFYDLIAYAKQHFSTPVHPDGWDSDRGRVLLKYGMPETRERHIIDVDKRPYEEWFYQQLPSQGPAEFVFVDLSGHAQYILVHSSAKGEVADPNWYNQYVKEIDESGDLQTDQDIPDNRR